MFTIGTSISAMKSPMIVTAKIRHFLPQSSSCGGVRRSLPTVNRAYPSTMENPMRVTRGGRNPLSEIELRTSRSSGPGGQHANVTASRVEAIFDLAASQSLDDEQRRRIMARCGPVVRAVAQDTRSQ